MSNIDAGISKPQVKAEVEELDRATEQSDLGMRKEPESPTKEEAETKLEENLEAAIEHTIPVIKAQ